jgi:hypothetical protein
MVTPVCGELGSSSSAEGLGAHLPRELRLDVDPFTRAALEHEAAQLDVSVEEFVRFAVLYYLADHDSGRIARRLPMISLPDQHPLGHLLSD